MADTTVAELVDLIVRQKQALSEGGRPDLAAHAHVVVRGDGRVTMRFEPIASEHRPDSDPIVLKAMSLDPAFMADLPGEPT